MERVKLQEQEFFAAREPEIAQAQTAHARGNMIETLKNAEPGTRERRLFEEFEIAKRIAEASSVFARESGRFPLTGCGDVNTYALFTETFASMICSAGRCGIIVPTGIATDATTAPFFSSLIGANRIISVCSFENEEFIFPSVHHAFKFSILTLSSGRTKGIPDFIFFARQVAQVADSRRHFELDLPAFRRINPNSLTAPVFRSRADAELTTKIHARTPVLIADAGAEIGNAWKLRFHTRIWHMAEDSEYFRIAGSLASSEGYLPLMEAKMIHQFDHRWSTYDGADGRAVTQSEKADPTFEPKPRYWVPADEVRRRLSERGWTRQWLLGWRDITNATNERSLIAAVVPLQAVGHTTPLIFPDEVRALPVACLISNLSSVVLDYIVRQKVGGTHLAINVLKQLPIHPPNTYTAEDTAWITRRTLELTFTSNSMASFARDLGYDGPPFPWDEDRRALLRAELDAWYARAYGLNRDELRYILDPADVMGEDYPSETFRVLKNNEMRKYGEYRTRRLVLEAWNRLAQAESTTQLPDGAWVMPNFNSDTVTAQLAAILKALPGPTPELKVRLAAIYALHPQYLTSRLKGTAQREWQRLTGSRTQSGANVINFVSRTSIEWRDAYAQLKGMGALIEDAATHTWAVGPAAHGYYTEGWPDGRAGLVMKAVEEIGVDAAITGLPSEVQQWVREYAA